jgi:hypothetical protein
MEAICWMGKHAADRLLRAGFRKRAFLPETSEPDRETIIAARPFTMTSIRRLEFLLNSISYLHANRIPGDIVECGVWKGGSIIAAAQKLASLGDLERQYWLYDTFEGMPAPTREDGPAEARLYESRRKSHESAAWCACTLAEVQQNLFARARQLREAFHFVRGMVEKTLRDEKNLPKQIALLRLDTDWYSSTKVELECLMPRVARNGVVIIDDYGQWQGSRLATDEFIAGLSFKPLLIPVDWGCRAFIKSC